MKKLFIISGLSALLYITTSIVVLGQNLERNGYQLDLSETKVNFLNSFEIDSVEINVTRSKRLRNAKMNLSMKSTPEGVWYKIRQIDQDHFRLYLLTDDMMRVGTYSLLISAKVNNLSKGIVLILEKHL